MKSERNDFRGVSFGADDGDVVGMVACGLEVRR